MNIGNITSDNFNLDGNGKDIQIEVYEQLIEQLQQENQKYKEVIDKAIEYIESKEYEYGDEGQDNYIYDIGFDEVNELLDILKEAENIEL